MELLGTRKELYDDFSFMINRLNILRRDNETEELTSLIVAIQTLNSGITSINISYTDFIEKLILLISAFEDRYQALILKPGVVKGVYIKLLGVLKRLKTQESVLTQEYLQKITFPSNLNDTERRSFVIQQLFNEIGRLFVESTVAFNCGFYNPFKTNCNPLDEQRRTVMNVNELFNLQMVRYYIENAEHLITKPSKVRVPVNVTQKRCLS